MQIESTPHRPPKAMTWRARHQFCSVHLERLPKGFPPYLVHIVKRAPSMSSEAPTPSGPPTSTTLPTTSEPRRRPFLYITVVIGVAVFTSALVAVILLLRVGGKTDWIPVCQDVLKTSFQALAVGALGGLAKLILDQRKSRDADAIELRDRRYSFISDLVDLNRDIDTASLIIRANRSAISWTETVNGLIIPARSQLRDLMHSLNNWKEAGSPVFNADRFIHCALTKMDRYLYSLLEEYADHKQQICELQRNAERALDEEREQQLRAVWDAMLMHSFLNDLVQDDKGYGEYRKNYLNTLKMMRESLSPTDSVQLSLQESSLSRKMRAEPEGCRSATVP